ncbi:uncharacterized protein LOC124703545 isoform X2 [Lolium rigidum]|uniref:uncharacterized protein LOC124703545 isoform X2 n=1 Tax=Lolium rigidum TaxID=89674 RepID=UPI001F5D494E|nr:uncharacterized protein LOC124703545 isoform X2 [Lolium rigidum]
MANKSALSMPSMGKWLGATMPLLTEGIHCCAVGVGAANRSVGGHDIDRDVHPPQCVSGTHTARTMDRLSDITGCKASRGMLQWLAMRQAHTFGYQFLYSIIAGQSLLARQYVEGNHEQAYMLLYGVLQDWRCDSSSSFV